MTPYNSTGYDLKLDLRGAVRDLVVNVLRACAPALEALDSRAPLAELSCVTSEPGAPPQVVHSDTEARHADGSAVEERLLTIFVALGRISMRSGPTIVFPGTNTPAFHSACAARPGALREATSGVHLSTLEVGDCVVFDSRLFHAGGENMSDSRRSLLVVSWLDIPRCDRTDEGHPSRVGYPSPPPGSTYSLLPELAEAGVRLCDLLAGL